MKRKVTVLHLNDEGLTPVFAWQTSKKGFTNDVMSYLMKKFQNPMEFPAGYDQRSLKTGDRIQLELLEGPLAGKVITYELVSNFSYIEV